MFHKNSNDNISPVRQFVNPLTGEKGNMAGKCPHCNVQLSYVNLQTCDVHVAGHNRWVGSSYICPACQAILSVSIDPIALKTDIIEKVVEEVKRLLRP